MLFVTLAYSLLRLDTLTHLKLSISEALKSGLSWGLYYDAVMALLAIVTVLLLSRLHRLIGGLWWEASGSRFLGVFVLPT